MAKTVKYTLFASGLNYGGRNTELSSKNYKDDIAILFDAVSSHELSLDSEKTTYTVESKSTRADHIISRDGQFSFTAYVNSSPMYIIDKNFIDQDTDKDNPVSSKRPQKAYDVLKRIREEKSVVTLVTEDFILTDYAITGLNISRDTAEGSALVFQITLGEFRSAEVGKTVLGKTVAGNRTNKTAMQDNKSTGTKNSGNKDLTFYEMKSPIKTGVGKQAEEILSKAGINVPKIDAPAGVIKPDGTVVRN